MSADPSPTPAPPPPANPPAFKGLGEAERAKIDYQASIDSQKMRFWRGARWWELFWDKLIFGVTVVLLGGLLLFPINCWMNSRRSADVRELERYKLEEARQRFFLEKRLEAMLAMSAALSDVSRVYFAAAEAGPSVNAEATTAEYQKALASAREVINRSSLLFDRAFNEDVDRYYQVHRQMMLLGPKEFPAYREFMADLSTEFDELCSRVLRSGEKDAPPPKRMPIADIPYSERINMKPKDYLQAHVEHWKKVMKK
jgi:hypothetical protein